MIIVRVWKLIYSLTLKTTTLEQYNIYICEQIFGTPENAEYGITFLNGLKCSPTFSLHLILY